MSTIPDDLKPTRIDENTMDFLGIKFVSTPKPKDTWSHVAKPEKLAEVELIGEDGNVFNLLGICLREGKRAGYTKEQLDAFMAEAQSGDYDNALATMRDWFTVR